MRLALAALLLAAGVAAAEPLQGHVPVVPKPPATAMQKAIDSASCTGEYADAILALSRSAREFERQPETNYSYCLRNTAVYECVFYGSDGRLKKRSTTAIAHGTAFAYKERLGETFLLTNEHIASWPPVTDEDHEVAGVPPGCKKVDEDLALVKDERDDYEPGHIALSKVATDPALDVAVVKTRQKIGVIPYRLGRSALLKAGNIIEVRGFPLGLLQATNFGKVVSAYDHDRERGWDHLDFVVDALLSKGSSGSPVLAISCRTGELELVGIFHASYRGSPALNVVVAIDQVREFMETFRRTRQSRAGDEGRPVPAIRTAILEGLRKTDALPFFKIGDRVGRARLEPDGAVVFEVFSVHFPAKDLVSVAVRDGPGDGPSDLAAFAVAGAEGHLRWVRVEEADAESQEVARRVLDLCRLQFSRTLAYRDAAAISKSSREAFRRASALSTQLDRDRGDAQEALKALGEIAGRLPPPPSPPPPPPADAPGNVPAAAVGAPPAPAAQGPTAPPPAIRDSPR